jgi:O-acetyl-ADP-ribose deacetylase (regulator of RNase III)
VIVDGGGNLLTADTEALVNTVNTVGVMGKGIALQFKRAFPANYSAYRAACGRGEVQLGAMFVFDTGRLGVRRYVINFPTKGHWRSRSRIEDIRSGLNDLVRVVRERRIRSIAVPALGCGNGGLAWPDVRSLIVEAFAGLPDVDVIVFPPAGAPDPQDMPVATDRPRMTSGRAVLLATMEKYLSRAMAIDLRDGVSELEIQKLAYFLQTLGQPLRLSFVRHFYGPYAEQLHHVLQEMEGHYLVGYGDRSSHVQDLQPIRLIDDAGAAAVAWLRSHDPQAIERIEVLLRLIDGFETPYSMELLATVHFAASQERGSGVAELVDTVRAWSGRKARLFTSDHVQVAYERLSDQGLMSVDMVRA